VIPNPASGTAVADCEKLLTEVARFVKWRNDRVSSSTVNQGAIDALRSSELPAAPQQGPAILYQRGIEALNVKDDALAVS
jgi:hypothetical protein